MIAPIVFLGVCLLIAAGVLGRRARHRRQQVPPRIMSHEELLRAERYGGWEPCAYDADTGRDHTPALSHRMMRGGSRIAHTPGSRDATA